MRGRGLSLPAVATRPLPSGGPAGPDNLFPDPSLADAATWLLSPTGVTYEPGRLIFNSVSVFDNARVTGDAMTAFHAALAGLSSVMVSVEVENFAVASGRFRMRSGAIVSASIAGNGWSVPVEVAVGAGAFSQILGTGVFDIVAIRVEAP